MTELRLTHPRLDFYVDDTICERSGRFMAAADLAEESRDIGVGDTPRDAVRAALAECQHGLPGACHIGALGGQVVVLAPRHSTPASKGRQGPSWAPLGDAGMAVAGVTRAPSG